MPIEPDDFQILTAIRDAGPLSTREVADRLGLDYHVANRRCSQLSSEGYVHRTESYWYLTRWGEEMVR